MTHNQLKKLADKYGLSLKYVTSWAPPSSDDLRPLIAMPNIPKPLHTCLRGDAEVLTTDGWKRIDSVTTEDTVATWDKDTEKIVWDHPYETVKKYSKQMVRIKFDKYKTFGTLTTPEHRIPIRKQTDGRKQVNGVRKFVGREWVLVDTTAAKINLNAFQHFITAARNGTDKTDELTNLERVYIAIQADGSLRNEKNGEYTYRFSFKKPRKKARLANLCWGSGVKFHEHNHGKGSYAAVKGYQRFDVVVDKECKSFWNCFDINSFGKEKAQQFLDEISLWDGSCAETCGILNRRYVTTNLDNAKFAQAVAVIAGVTSSFQVNKKDGNDKWSPTYIIDFLDRDYRATQSCVKTVEDYDDYAYCINVPTSYFVVRDADSQSVMITGNCAPRTVLGPTVWNKMRKDCYEKAHDTCEICGECPEDKRKRHAHECYVIDYEKGTCTFIGVFCVCALDHLGAIHTGRALTLWSKGSPLITKEFLLEGAEKAFSLIHDYNKEHKADVRLYSTYIEYLKHDELREPMLELIKKYDVKFYSEDPKRMAKWSEWRLLLDGEEYPTPYKNEKAWQKAMEEKTYNDGFGKGRVVNVQPLTEEEIKEEHDKLKKF